MTDGEAPIEIVSYDLRWPALFREERQRLQCVLAPWLAGSIEHIGSTAVPGMAAKPVIDIIAGVSSLGTSRSAIEAATTLGYCYFPYRPDVEHWFCKPSPAHRTHHLHLVPVGSPQWIRPIAFRQVLEGAPGRRDGIRGTQARLGIAIRTRSRGIHGREGTVHRQGHRRSARLRLWSRANVRFA